MFSFGCFALHLKHESPKDSHPDFPHNSKFSGLSIKFRFLAGRLKVQKGAIISIISNLTCSSLTAPFTSNQLMVSINQFMLCLERSAESNFIDFIPFNYPIRCTFWSFRFLFVIFFVSSIFCLGSSCICAIVFCCFLRPLQNQPRVLETAGTVTI